MQRNKMKKFDEIIKEAQKIREKYEKQLKQFKR
jgi:hypothetical protein